jgi:hypothetical protein
MSAEMWFRDIQHIPWEGRRRLCRDNDVGADQKVEAETTWFSCGAPLPRYRRLNGHGRRCMSDKVVKKTKAQLHEMLAEAVRNTQPQPVNAQPEPVRDAQPKPKTRPRKTRPAPKRSVKIKDLTPRTKTLHR